MFRRRSVTTSSAPAPETDGGSPDGERPRGPARALVESGLLDVEFYEAQTAERFESPLAAARHAVAVGMPARLSPHPFLDFHAMPGRVRRAWRAGRVRVVLEHLGSDEGRAAPYGPLFDPRAHPVGAGNPLVDFLARSDDATPMPLPRGRVDPEASPQRGEARAHLIELAAAVNAPQPAPSIDWDAAGADRVAGRTSIVIPTYDDAVLTARAVDAVLATTSTVTTDAATLDVEVVVVDNGSRIDVALSLAAAFLARPRVRLLRAPRNLQFAGGSNLGFVASTGQTVVFLNNDTEARRGWLPPLLAALEDPQVAGAQPLLLYGDDTIQTAGTIFLRAGYLPSHLLAGHPPEDAGPLAGGRFDVVTAAALAMRADDVITLRGFDEGYVNGFEDVDLCLRALEVRPGGFRVVPDSRVTHHESKTPGRFAKVLDNRRRFVERWSGRLPAPTPEVYAELGFAISVGDDGTAIPAARATVTGRLPAASARRRWGIRVPAPAGVVGDGADSVRRATALAEALRARGEEAVTHRVEAQELPVVALDDVVVAIDPGDPGAERPGRGAERPAHRAVGRGRGPGRHRGVRRRGHGRRPGRGRRRADRGGRRFGPA